MKISTIVMMVLYVVASFIVTPFLTFAVAVNTEHLGVNIASGLALATAILLVASLLFIGSKIPLEMKGNNRPL